jgi:cysteine desulfurase
VSRDAIYLDYQSTTPCDERVVQAMLPYFTNQFANPSSLTHAAGRKNAEVVDQARQIIADFIHAQPRDLIFTASATEANNLALKGVMGESQKDRDKLLVCQIDHPSVLNPARELRESGYQVHFLKVDPSGKILKRELEELIDENTKMLSICHGNSEIGSLQDLTYLAGLCREHGVLFHVDATQAALTERIDVEAQQIDLLSLSAHKLYGPKGVGLLYRRRKQPRVRLQALMRGGDQEWGLRAGTLNVPGIVGLAKACELITACRDEERARLEYLRNYLKQKLQQLDPDLWVNGGEEDRLPHNLNVGFPGLDAQRLLCEIEEIQCSKGSSCSLDIAKPSHVLLGIGLGAELADQCLRFSVGRMTLKEDLDRAVLAIEKHFQKERPVEQKVVS